MWCGSCECSGSALLSRGEAKRPEALSSFLEGAMTPCTLLDLGRTKNGSVLRVPEHGFVRELGSFERKIRGRYETPRLQGYRVPPYVAVRRRGPTHLWFTTNVELEERGIAGARLDFPTWAVEEGSVLEEVRVAEVVLEIKRIEWFDLDPLLRGMLFEGAKGAVDWEGIYRKFGRDVCARLLVGGQYRYRMDRREEVAAEMFPIPGNGASAPPHEVKSAWRRRAQSKPLPLAVLATVRVEAIVLRAFESLLRMWHEIQAHEGDLTTAALGNVFGNFATKLEMRAYANSLEQHVKDLSCEEEEDGEEEEGGVGASDAGLSIMNPITSASFAEDERTDEEEDDDDDGSSSKAERAAGKRAKKIRWWHPRWRRRRRRWSTKSTTPSNTWWHSFSSPVERPRRQKIRRRRRRR